ncbi:Flp pilus assembly protein TadG [Salinihabitans flavidus]|uniref:Flp pilus assembly protein TadG n=1 Tax=Salinihabitans flavidus TaxID=569882 RepID=A0A1H8P274_9RHOB|nr:TadE/TadG family type IV pilus assembly protein [Salinihabitans flavidus]SEO35965.1 Flp pilus assembly protein TadG [Salinihabitans flavidus]
MTQSKAALPPETGPARGFRRHLARLAIDESGVVTGLAIFIFLIILMVGGLGIDLMRSEMRRTDLQNTLDRAILAAADLDQDRDPELVVRSYFDATGLTDYLGSVTVDDGLNYRTVSADASMTMNTHFMKLAGVDTLTVPARGTAEERIANVEISLVLDISGSMAGNSRITNLRAAAKEFVDAVIRPETEDLISLSIVPYTAQVNAGPLIFNELNVNQVHNFSHCIEFYDSEFSTTALDTERTYNQMQHFEAGSYYNNPITNPGCPRRDYERITAFSQNGSALKDQIDNLRPRANTSIHLGMKWGAALLDPSFQPITGALAAGGHVDSEFSGRPAAFNDSETLKTVILMTDGENVTTRRIADHYYDSESEISHWNRYPLYYYLNNYVSWYYRSGFYYTKYSAHHADNLLDNICDAARAQGIVIWSIGFEVTNHGADVMRSCASSDAHFFRVEGVEISDAFSAIARQINQLRLTQ